MPELTDADLDDLMAAIGLTPPKNRGGSKRKPITHGTYRGVKQHYYRGEKLCDDCRDAERAYQTQRRHGRTGYLTEEEWQAHRAAKDGAR
ncbi:MAG TPA: hypothetical protein VFY14_10880 [Streptomyces sp.]|nr:hypothetical protein [Streptomyces sp.]